MNAAALKAANRDFVLLLRELDLWRRGCGDRRAFFHATPARPRFDAQRLAAELAAVDREIEAYNKELDTNDAAEAERSPGSDGGGATCRRRSRR